MLNHETSANYNFANSFVFSNFAPTNPYILYMERIIGIENEMAKLTDYQNSGRSEFIAIYGRPAQANHSHTPPPSFLP